MESFDISSDFCAVILAGGRGTRLGNICNNVPKPMIKVLDKPFIEWLIRYLKKQGIENYIISLGYLAEVAQEYLKGINIDNVNIKSVIEKEPLGTGGGFMLAAKEADSYKYLLLTNGDSMVLSNLGDVWNMLRYDNIDGIIIGTYMKDVSRYGTLDIDENGFLRGFKEKAPGSGIINAGVYILKRELISMFPQKFPLSMEVDVFPHLLKNKARIKVFKCEVPFIDIGTPESLGQAEHFIQENLNRGDLFDYNRNTI